MPHFKALARSWDAPTRPWEIVQCDFIGPLKQQKMHSDLFGEITRRVACKQTFTTGSMPTGNARVERMHKTLENLVSVYISDNHRKWPDLVPIAL